MGNYRTGWGALALLGLGACGQPSGPGELLEREARAVRPAALVPEMIFKEMPGLADDPWMRHYGLIPERFFASVAQQYPDLLDRYPELGRMNPRFLQYVLQLQMSQGMGQPPVESAEELARAAATMFAYDLPAGWEELPGTANRIFNLRPAGDPDAECSFSLLPSDGGGIVRNVNRWRGQMGLEALSEQEVKDLPRRDWFAQEGATDSLEGVVVDLKGGYTPMMGEPRSDWAMLGLISITPVGAMFMKMTGPEAVVEDERERFFAFAESMRLSDVARAQEEERLRQDDAGGPAPAGGAGIDPASITWEAPEGWTDQGARIMRHVSYQAAPETEAYLAFARGGKLANYNRWCGQVGASPLTQAELDALPTVTVLGQECPLLEVSGEYRGMGNVHIPSATLVGAMCSLGGDDLFVKMIGPAAEVTATMKDFLAFCESVGSK